MTEIVVVLIFTKFVTLTIWHQIPITKCNLNFNGIFHYIVLSELLNTEQKDCRTK